MSATSSPAAPPPGPQWDPYTYRPSAPAPQPFQWLRAGDPGRKAPATRRVVGLALAAGVLTSWLLADALGVNLLLCGLVTAVGAGIAARSAGRSVRPWTVVWSVLALVLLTVPALYEADWAVVLSGVCALGLASLALHGGKRWLGVLLALPGLAWQLVPSVRWARTGLRGLGLPGGRGKAVSVLKAALVAAVLLAVFGGLFVSADAAMAEVLEDLIPRVELEPGDLPQHAFLFCLGLLVSLGFAHIAAGPRRWDRTVVKPGRPRGRLEWAVPLAALNLLFGAFAVIQAIVVLGGRDAIMAKTGMSRSEYARQGFWQLMVITVLTLVVVAVANRWAPRATESDRRLAKLLLGALCTLTLVVVASALGRMWYYVDASGLTQLRLWVLVVEIWLGVVLLLVIVAGARRAAGWLPRAVVLSAMATAAVYGLMSPDAMVAEQNVARYRSTDRIDLRNIVGLSLDAVPALDRLPADQRACALSLVTRGLTDGPRPWYATSLSESRARDLLAARPVTDSSEACDRIGFHGR
ncbi:DUF4153 domain-containing protein [Kitasatospora sp. NPDC101801]|uniref:DUF4153 domain-containing protein n=1 Tax=Kitasatospora sp. NPDC101801 TaxID=3364103 RepID=UPI00381C7B38